MEFWQKHRHAEYSPKEVFYRWIGIVVLGILLPLIFREYVLLSWQMAAQITASVARAAILWYGSEFIVSFITTRIPIFEYPARNLGALFLCLAVLVMITETLDIRVQERIMGAALSKDHRLTYYITALLITFFITTFYGAVFFFLQWKNNLLKNEKLERATIEARYNSLKNQVNPHFLFNSLNTLLTMVDEHSQPAHYIRSMAGFLRYILKAEEKEVVLLRDELQFTLDYAFMQQSRFGGNLIIQMDVPEQFYHYSVPPLSLQMLLENAIKHNIISQEKPLSVYISVSGDKYIEVSNELQKKQHEPSTGLGLENIRKRFAFLTERPVRITSTEASFKVGLPLIKESL
jgi:two-component system, LytTR family, sensor kinase